MRALRFMLLCCLVGTGSADAELVEIAASASSTVEGYSPGGATDGDRFSTSHPSAWRGSKEQTSWWWEARFAPCYLEAVRYRVALARSGRDWARARRSRCSSCWCLGGCRAGALLRLLLRALRWLPWAVLAVGIPTFLRSLVPPSALCFLFARGGP